MPAGHPKLLRVQQAELIMRVQQAVWAWLIQWFFEGNAARIRSDGQQPGGNIARNREVLRIAGKHDSRRIQHEEAGRRKIRPDDHRGCDVMEAASKAGMA